MGHMTIPRRCSRGRILWDSLKGKLRWRNSMLLRIWYIVWGWYTRDSSRLYTSGISCLRYLRSIQQGMRTRMSTTWHYWLCSGKSYLYTWDTRHWRIPHSLLQVPRRSGICSCLVKGRILWGICRNSWCKVKAGVAGNWCKLWLRWCITGTGKSIVSRLKWQRCKKSQKGNWYNGCWGQVGRARCMKGILWHRRFCSWFSMLCIPCCYCSNRWGMCYSILIDISHIHWHTLHRHCHWYRHCTHRYISNNTCFVTRKIPRCTNSYKCYFVADNTLIGRSGTLPYCTMN